jgi:membrane-associated PAP2 superfamily phosphatase
MTWSLLLALLLWDASGADLRVARLFADAHGFASRDSVWASAVVHGGGRWLAWSLAAALIVVACARPREPSAGRTAASACAGSASCSWCAIAIPAMKQVSMTSCPWDLAEFGGHARYLSHWSWGLADGGAGHCFPAGHAVAAFAFIGMYFLWRPHDRTRARAWLVGVLRVGTLFGVGQLVRGAHYPSHTLWSAWICWAVVHAAPTGCSVRDGRRLLGRARPPAAAGGAAPPLARVSASVRRSG